MSIHASITVHHAVTGKRNRVAKIHLWNTGEGTPEVGEYRYRIRFDGKNHEGSIHGFRRDQEHGAIKLIRMVLENEIQRTP